MTNIVFLLACKSMCGVQDLTTKRATVEARVRLAKDPQTPNLLIVQLTDEADVSADGTTSPHIQKAFRDEPVVIVVPTSSLRIRLSSTSLAVTIIHWRAPLQGRRIAPFSERPPPASTSTAATPALHPPVLPPVIIHSICGLLEPRI